MEWSCLGPKMTVPFAPCSSTLGTVVCSSLLGIFGHAGCRRAELRQVLCLAGQTDGLVVKSCRELVSEIRARRQVARQHLHPSRCMYSTRYSSGQQGVCHVPKRGHGRGRLAASLAMQVSEGELRLFGPKWICCQKIDSQGPQMLTRSARNVSGSAKKRVVMSIGIEARRA